LQGRDFLANSAEIFKDLTRSLNRCLNVRLDIVLANMVNKLSLLQEPRGLIASAAQYESPSGLLQAIA
jgi:hypothetical protein